MSRRPRSRSPRDARPVVLAAAAVEACEPRRLFAYVAPAFADQIGLSGVLNYNTTFEDNFDGSSLDKTKWQVRDGYRWRAYKDAPVSTFSYTDESAIQVGNGELQLIAHNDATTGQLKGAFLQTGRQFNDNSINSPVPKATLTNGYSGDFEQAYGYWETRAKFSSLPGMWSAFWVHSYRMTEIRNDASKVDQPEIFGTEYDIVEHSAIRNTTSSTPNDVTVIAHANGYGSYHEQAGAYPATANLGPSKSTPAGYHVYGLLWTSTSAKFYIDGNLVHSVTDPALVSQVPQMALLSVEVGAGGSLEPGKGSNFFGYTPSGGYGSKSTSQARATFDYVRVWQLKNVSAPNPTATASASGIVWVDDDKSAARESGEAVRAGATVFADYDGDGVRDAGEPYAVTASNGSYTITGIAPKRQANLTLAPISGYTVTSLGGSVQSYVTYPGRLEQRHDFGIAAGSTTTQPPPPPPPTGSASAASYVFVDANGNGKRDTGELGLANAIVFADVNYNGVRDATEKYDTTSSDGSYRIDNLPVGVSLQIRLVGVAGYAQTSPANNGGYSFKPYAGQLNTSTSFGVKSTSTTTTPPPPAGDPTTPPTSGTASAASYVFVDANGNGVRDSGESGLAGAIVFADVNYNGVRDATEKYDTTASDGSYRIDNLPVGVSIQVRLAGVAGYAQTSPASNGGYSFKPYAGQLNTSTRFGVKSTGGGSTTTPPPSTGGDTTSPPAAGTASAASYVFNDVNGNGVRDAGELGLANAIVFADVNYNGVRDANEKSATTGSDGSYRIDNLPLNTSLQIRLVPISGYAQTSPANNGGYSFKPYANQLNTKTLFGVKSNGSTTPPPPTPTPTPTDTASVAGVVFVDANANGRRDSNEGGKNAARVFVDYDADGILDANEPSALTGSDGAYRIDGVRTGQSVAVTLVKTGVQQTAPSNNGAYWFRPYAGQVNAALNFGVRAAIAVAATLALASSKALAYAASTSDTAAYPIVTSTTTGAWQPQPATHWASGFYPGTLWLAYERDGAAATRDAARAFTAGLAGQQYFTGGHDVGFQIFNSFGQGYRLTEDAAYLSVLLNAARSLSSRFNTTTGAIRSWDWTGGPNHPVIIDSLMNLELLMWAHKHGGTSAIPGYTLEQIAVSHADKLLGSHLRADGSVFHVVEFDPTTGDARDPVAYAGYQQAYSTTSTWSRGEAWAIYGYTMMFRETGLTRYRDAAQKAADYFIAHLPADGVPPADFIYGTASVPFTTAQKDASAGAIAASAMIELATLANAPQYEAAAEGLLEALTSPEYLSGDASSASALTHASHNARTPDDAGYVWGDYYLMEALTRLSAQA